MNLRLLATAFIFNEARVLMLKRSIHKKIAPGLWSGVGGHIEPSELNDPKSACLREIFEETGILEDELLDVKLRYILIRKIDTEIRQHFVYFCQTEKNELIHTDEGELHWINIDEIDHLKKPKIIELMLRHYFENDNPDDVYVGTMIDENSEASMRWVKLSDPGDV